MRDIALTLLVFGLLPFIFVRAYYGALLWAWIGMMNPHRMTWGFALQIPFAMVVAIPTLIAVLFSKERKPVPWCAPLVILVIYWLWTSVTSLFAVAPTAYVYEGWLKFTKIQLMLFVTLMLIQDRQKLDQLIWVIVASIGFFGYKGGIWTLLTGGGERVYGPPGGFIQGNNEIALAMVITVPFMYYLAMTASESKSLPILPKLQKYGLWAGMAFSAVSVLGTHSRGGFVAIAAMSFFLGWMSRYRVLTSIAIVIGLLLAISFMPEHWAERMRSITTHADSSAQGRFESWAMIFNLALERPLVGAGFDFISHEVWSRYAAGGTYRHAYGAHSIWFQVLGEHGFPGLGLYLLIGLTTWVLSVRLSFRCAKVRELQWVILLMRMTQVSLVGFAVGGTFLGLANWDLPFYLTGIVAITNAIVNRTLAEKAHKHLSQEAAGSTSVRGMAQVRPRLGHLRNL